MRIFENPSSRLLKVYQTHSIKWLVFYTGESVAVVPRMRAYMNGGLEIIISPDFASENPVSTRYPLRHWGNVETLDPDTTTLISVDTVYIRVRPGISLINGNESSNTSSLYRLLVHARQRSVIPVTTLACWKDHIGFMLSSAGHRIYNPRLLFLSYHIH